MCFLAQMLTTSWRERMRTLTTHRYHSHAACLTGLPSQPARLITQRSIHLAGTTRLLTALAACCRAGSTHSQEGRKLAPSSNAGKENTSSADATASRVPPAKVPLLRRASAPLVKLALGAAGKAQRKGKKTKSAQFSTTRAGSAPLIVSAKTTVGGSHPSRAKGKGLAASASESQQPASSIRWKPGLHMVMARKKGAGFARSFSLKGRTPRKARKMPSAAPVDKRPQSDVSSRRLSLRSSSLLPSAYEYATTEEGEPEGEWF